MSKTHLQQRLAEVMPSVFVSTIWEHDEDSRFDEHGMTAPGGCFHGEDPDDWQAWRSEVCAEAIVLGAKVTGSAYLGGTWERYGTHPRESNPDISGYELQMTCEALGELRKQVEDAGLIDQLDAGIALCREEMSERYLRQQEERTHG